jgi:zinc protease
MVWYRVGAADEPERKSGIAHFMEHLMFKGSEGLAPGEFSEIIRGLGGNDNAFTSQDYTAYFQSIASEHLETVMRMEAGRMRGMNPPPDEFASEHKVILEERSQRIDNNPSSQLGEKMSAALHEHHPYGDPVIGWREEMESLSWKDAKEFYDRWYAPNNAILVVSGDVTDMQVVQLAVEIYGPLERRDIPPRIRRKKETAETGIKTVRVADPAVHQPSMRRDYLVPSYRQSPVDSLAFQIMEEIMGGGPTSRLYRALVIGQHLATSTGMHYQSAAWDSASLSVYATPKPGISLDKVEHAILLQLQKLADKGVSAQELADAKARLQAEAIYARDSLTGPAMIFGYSLITGSMMNDVEYWADNIAQVTAEQVQAAAQKYLIATAPDFRNAVTGYLLPADEKMEQK